MSIIGIDPGAKDRTAIVVLGWGEDTGLWVVEEWVTDRNSGTVWSDIGEQLKRIQAKWRPSWYYADFAGSAVALDTFGRDFGVPMIMAAKKSARRFQVDRVNDGLSTGEIHIPIGSQLEGDLIKTQWDKDERNKWVGVFIGVLAVLLAICNVGGANATKDATHANIAASDTWAFYQAKNIRRTSTLLSLSELERLISLV